MPDEKKDEVVDVGKLDAVLVGLKEIRERQERIEARLDAKESIQEDEEEESDEGGALLNPFGIRR
jgi:hypothetical protein